MGGIEAPTDESRIHVGDAGPQQDTVEAIHTPVAYAQQNMDVVKATQKIGDSNESQNPESMEVKGQGNAG